MIVGGQTSARVLTIIDYHAPFDPGIKFAKTSLTFKSGSLSDPHIQFSFSNRFR